MSSSATATRAVSTDILPFPARVAVPPARMIERLRIMIVSAGCRRTSGGCLSCAANDLTSVAGASGTMRTFQEAPRIFGRILTSWLLLLALGVAPLHNAEARQPTQPTLPMPASSPVRPTTSRSPRSGTRGWSFMRTATRRRAASRRSTIRRSTRSFARSFCRADSRSRYPVTAD